MRAAQAQALVVDASCTYVLHSERQKQNPHNCRVTVLKKQLRDGLLKCALILVVKDL